ncbi:hypothetical protein [Tepidimicrobium xylanilyticum]|uniref:Oxaloacetate decarboxylase, gamma chain n=1 Tax=Tepidimicrobium xylanilyticum TaxID=1123352 RepID=A0A1H2TIA8_9FIRM|nr:hypothetical protein [Tepidimicrobium xylanilyticum]SDW43004.1 hypothetical protein SAMN05660923_00707 [Tepidimicrobium xylanilyticum]
MNIDAFLQKLPIGAYGLGSTFFAMVIIYFGIGVLRKVFTN